MRTLPRLLLYAAALFGPLCTWAQAEVEPNDNAASANAISYNTAVTGTIGTCLPTNTSADYFTLTPPQQGTMRIQASLSNSGASDLNVTIQVRNSNTTLLQSFTATAGANNVPVLNTFNRLCAGTGVYYITVINPGGSVCTSYSITYDILSPVYGNDAEPNQSAAQAVVAAPGVNVDGHLDFLYDDNFDYFKLQAPNDGVLNVTIAAENASASAGTMTLYLRNSNGTALQTWTMNVGANGSAVTNTFTQTCIGTENVYYLEPYSPSLCGVSYRFSYTVTAPAYGDDLEPNQGTAAAVVANANTDYDGRVDFDYDNNFDYFKLQAPTDGVLNISISAESAGPDAGTMTLYLRNNNNTALHQWSVNVGANGVPVANSFSHTCTGTENVYYLEPYSPSSCGVSYRFNYTVSAPAYADDAEPNQGTAQAILVDLASAPADGRMGFEYDNDFDYFRINHTGGPIVVYTLAENAGPAGTMTVYVRSSGGTALLTDNGVAVGGNGVPVADTVTTASLAAGTYYIETYGPSVCGVSYRLKCYDEDNDGVCNGSDLCPGTPNGESVNSNGCSCSQVTISDGDVCTLDQCASGVVTHTFQDADGDLTCDANDACPNDPNKIAPGQCGCGVADADADNDGTADCNDGCPSDPNKVAPGLCGCGVADTDSDNDGTPNCTDGCANDPNKIAPGICGCGVSDVDTDSDGTADCNDGCANDPNKVAPGVCGCGVADTDSDNDGTPDCNDGCANDPNKIAPGLCGCGVADTDSDNDGTPNCNDACPLLPNLVNGDPCDDGNVNSVNDVVTNCICAGTLLGNDCNGVPGGPAQPGTACDDGDVCTINDVYQANCTCAGTFQDTDNDGVCDASDSCPTLTGQVGDACDDGDVCTTNDVIGADCVCAGSFQDTDNDGVCDASDSCPTLFGEVGDACDDNNANTGNDVIGANCVCAGTLAEDCNGVPGGPAQPGTTCDDGDACTINDVYQANCTCAGTFQDTDNDGVCDASDSCPTLTGQVGDACNDGNVCTVNDVITAGCVCVGTFQDTDNDGVCDASDSCPTLTGQVGDACNDGNACTANDVITSSCACAGTFQDTDGDGICNANDNCPSLFGQIGDACNDGNANTTNDVIGANCVCAGTSVSNTCQPTQLTTTADPVVSCGITGAQLNGSTILYAVNVPGANRYQFNFTNIPGQPAYTRNIASATRSLPLYTWATTPLKKGRTYQVRVRASFDNGATWCPYDATCNVTISNNALSMLRDVEDVEGAEDVGTASFDLFPNPTTDGGADLRYANAGMQDDTRITIDVLDALGRVVLSEQRAIADGRCNAHLQLPAERSTGLYIVRLTVGEEMIHRQLMVH